jgi:hypothetical protein
MTVRSEYAQAKQIAENACSAIMPQAKQISVIARKGSSLILVSAFHPAWSAAAVETATKTRRGRMHELG